MEKVINRKHRIKSGLRASGSISRRSLAETFRPSSPIMLLGIFLVIALFTGGGSRHDITSLIVLRPLAFGFAAYALIQMRADELASVRTPLLFLIALAGLVLLQLIPLPPALWSQIEGRGAIADVYESAGMDVPWLPLALSPSRALNTLMALSVPLAALLLFARVEPADRQYVIYIIWGMACASAMLGAVQILGPNDSPLYFYRFINDGLPVGFLPNRNHQSLLIGIGALAGCWIFARNVTRGSAGVLVRALAAGSLFVFLPMLLLAGSRAGLVLGVALLLPGGWLIYRALSSNAPSRNVAQRLKTLRIAFGAGAISLVATFITAIVFARSLAFDRLLDTSTEREIRDDWLPTIFEIARSQFPFGSGFGSFELVYKRAEPVDLLMPSYLNQAHNDWLQFVLEGGVLAAALLGAFVFWVLSKAWFMRSALLSGASHVGVFGFSVLMVFAASSIVDYPLRVPSLMAIFAVVCVLLADESRKA